MIEVWKDIPGYEGRFQASSHGRIKSLYVEIIQKNGKIYRRKETILNPSKMSKNRYFFVSIGFDRKTRKSKSVHRLVCETFNGLSNGMECNHKDGNIFNNNYSNLEWVTRKQNLKHQRENKLFRVGEESPFAKLNEKQAKKIKKTKMPLKYGDLSKIARKYKVSPATIRDIFVGNTWTHV